MAITASSKLQQSRLSDQLETLNTDIDLSSLNLGDAGKASFPLLESIVSADIARTIEGASTLTIVANDRDRTLLQSGYLGDKLDVNVDGLWFRMTSISKSGNQITLIFEDREVALLRTYPKQGDPHTYLLILAAKYGLRTRFKFAERLIADVKETQIRFVCPGLTEAALFTGDPASDTALNRGHGFPTAAPITVKGKTATANQRANIETVLQTGDAMGASTKVLIAAVAVVTQESTARTSATNGDHVGLFQQSAAAGWPATRDPEADATAFFEAAIGEDHKIPGSSIADLAEGVQISGEPALYAQWVDEARQTVELYLGGTLTLPSTTALDPNKGQFTRGTLESLTAALRKHKTIVKGPGGNKVAVREDDWTCLQRLASEIGWRCFCVSGTIYFTSDEHLFLSKVMMTLSEESDGVDAIDFDYTQRTRNAQVTVTCRADRWQAPPGTVVSIEDMGPASGRWLVTAIGRSLFNPATTITLKKPQPTLPESAAPEHGAGQGSGVTTLGAPGQASTGESGKQYRVGGTLVQPIPMGFATGESAIHQTEGLPGYPAIDFFAKAGSPVVAPENGKIVRFSGHDPAQGPTEGPHGPLGWSIYLDGDSGTSYYMTHLGTRTCAIGQRIEAGRQVGTVADYAKYGTPSHCHTGVSGGTVSIEQLAAAPLAVAP